MAVVKTGSGADSNGTARRADPHGPPASTGPKPPDGGWGWMVVFASFMIHVVTDGVTYSFGVLFKEFTEVFKEGDAMTSWIASLLVGVTLCSGPISSAFVNKYGCRNVTIAGSLLGSACLAVSVFAKNVTTLCITIGFGTGLGFGLIYLPAIVSVTCYFERLRSLATGIAVCGSGLGTIIFAPVIDYAVERHGWRATLLVLSVVVLSAIIFGIMFRPLEDPPKAEDELGGEELRVGEKQPMILTESVDSPDSDQKTLSTHNLSTENSDNNLSASNGYSKRPHSVHGHMIIPVIRENEDMSKNINNSSTLVVGALSHPMLWEDGKLVRSSTNINKSTRTLGSSHGGSGLMHKKDILYFGSVRSIAEHSTVKLTSETDGDVEASAVPREVNSNDGNSCGCISADTKQTLKEMLDMELLKDPIFMLFTLSNIFTSIGFNIPYVYLVKLAESRGVSSAASLLSIIGAANMVSRVILGYISDQAWVNRLYVYNTCLAICGAATFGCAFCYSYTSLAVYAAFYGAMVGAYVGLTSVILVDLLGLDRLTNAFGLLLLFQGIASLVGPPIAGFMYDSTLSYSPAFFMAGVAIFLSGVMLFVIPSMQNCIAKRKEKQLNRS